MAWISLVLLTLALWAACGGVIAVGRRIWSMQRTLIVHLFAAAAFAFAAAAAHKLLVPGFDPATRAAAMTALIVAVGAWAARRFRTELRDVPQRAGRPGFCSLRSFSPAGSPVWLFEAATKSDRADTELVGDELAEEMSRPPRGGRGAAALTAQARRWQSRLRPLAELSVERSRCGGCRLADSCD